MLRIAIGGFQHETNSFVPGPTPLEAFELADSWPGLLHGPAVIRETRGLNLPIAGFVTAAETAGDVALVPLLWCAAEPSGPVADTAFEHVAAGLERALAAAGPVDALYLDLHGAMICEGTDDGEGALLTRLRARLGAGTTIGISLDLHANLSPAMLDAADAVTIFRQYPHLDMAETGARCLPLIRAAVARGRPTRAFRPLPFLLPLHAQHTATGPLADAYGAVARAGGIQGAHAELALGFTAGDTPFTAPAIMAEAATEGAAEAVADIIAAVLLRAEAEAQFDTALPEAAEAVAQALAWPGRQPVVIADVQDNPGAGAASDSTGLLAALAAAGATDAVLGLLCDPAMAAAAHRAGPGATVEGALGARAGVPGDQPFAARFTVEALRDAPCRFTGAMYGGSSVDLGPSAVLRVRGVGAPQAPGLRVVVTSRRSQCLDRGLFTHHGIDPASARIVAVKSTLHYRADFAPIAGRMLSAAAPGGFPCRMQSLAYRRLSPGIRLGPGGPPWQPPAD
ncbi:MAG: M81 family metallopeptidase [Pseudomonadota bacterium]